MGARRRTDFREVCAEAEETFSEGNFVYGSVAEGSWGKTRKANCALGLRGAADRGEWL